MKLKNILGFIALGATLTTAHAQFSTDREVEHYAVVEYPDFYVADPAEHNYAVEVFSSRKIEYSISREEIADLVDIIGWSRNPNSNSAHLLIRFDMGPMLIEEHDVVRHVDKDNKGKEVVSFEPVVTYSFPFDVDFISKEFSRKISFNTSMFGKIEVKKYYTGHRFGLRHRAMEFIKDNKEVLVDQIIRDNVQHAAAEVSRLGTQAFGFAPTFARLEFHHLDSRKSPFYAQQEADADEIKSLIKSCDPYDAFNETALLTIIERYKKIISELNDKGGRKEKKAKIELMLSVGELYLMIDNIEQCKAWAQRVIDQYKDGDGKDLLKKAAKVEKILIKHHVSSRRFVPAPPTY